MALNIRPQAAVNLEICTKAVPPPGLPRGVHVSCAFDTFWKFAALRQEIFFSRLASPNSYPSIDDPVLSQHKFTNAYRASDRVSQYLIRYVIPAGPNSAHETFFRIILFKLFNRIETWQLLAGAIGIPEWRRFSFDRYDAILSRAMESGRKIYSAAYIMPSGGKSGRKHRHHLRLLEQMMADNFTAQLQRCRTMESAFLLLRSCPSIGDFLAYQFVTDLNYSEILNFSEMEFVCAGPGARDGIRKCFTNDGGKSEEWLIRWIAETQEDQFNRLGLRFRNLWGRHLQLIDCQNLSNFYCLPGRAGGSPGCTSIKGKSAWGFGLHTANRKAIQPGDKVLFYLTGLQVFAGAATLKSGTYEDKAGESRDWYLEPSTLRIDLEDVQVFPEVKPRATFKGIEWRPVQGGSSKISERDYMIIMGSEPDIIPTPVQPQEEMEFALEKYLEDFIVDNWDKIDFGEHLELFKDKDGNVGKQYYAGDVGYIDILAKDKNGYFIIIELKNAIGHRTSAPESRGKATRSSQGFFETLFIF